jgi:hypothetical protein
VVQRAFKGKISIFCGLHNLLPQGRKKLEKNPKKCEKRLAFCGFL